MSDIVIEVRDLTKRYGSTTAVDGVSFTVGRGEIFGLLGPNGAGKTTTLLMIIGLTDITSGSVSILGHDPVRDPLQIKRRIGYLPDSVGFYDHLTAVERLNGISFTERNQRIAAALGRAGLSDVGHKRVGAFSHGMRQRLGLAEIFMKNVDIAILDEPTSGLDPMATADFLETIQLLKHEGVAVLMSSTAGWSANSRGMLANGSSRGSLTLVRLTMPIAPVIAAVTKLAWAEKHIGAHF